MLNSLLGRRIRGDMEQGEQWGTERGGTASRFSRMISPGERLTGVEQEVTVSDATQRYRIGSRMQDGDRVFHYGQIAVTGGYGITTWPTQVRVGAGVATGIWPGNDETNVVGAVAGVAGAYTITYVCTANIAANQFQGGIIAFAGAQYGHSNRILSHALCLAGNTVILYLEDPLALIIAAGQAATLYRNPFACVYSPWQGTIEAIANPNNQRLTLIGMPLVQGLAGEFQWFQTWGPCVSVSGSGAEGTNIEERELVFDNQDGTVELAGPVWGAGRSFQRAGYILPSTNTAVALPAVGTGGGQNGMIHFMLQVMP